MLQLGYNHYVTQAGDWGYWITRALGLLYPQSVVASHLNMVLAKSPNKTETTSNVDLEKYNELDRRGLERTRWFEVEGIGWL